MNIKYFIALFVLILNNISIAQHQTSFEIIQPYNGQVIYATNSDSTATVYLEAKATTAPWYAVRINVWVQSANVLADPPSKTSQQICNYDGSIVLSPGSYSIYFKAEEQIGGYWYAIGNTQYRTVNVRRVINNTISLNETVPIGGTYKVDGIDYTSGVFLWPKNSTHSLLAPSYYVSPINQRTYKFSTWNDGFSSAFRSISVLSDKTYFAQYTQLPILTLNSTVPQGGVYNVDGTNYLSGAFHWESSSNHNITAPLLFTSPIDQVVYAFSNWSDGLQNNTRSISITSDITLYAQYTIAPPSAPINLHFTYQSSINPSFAWDLNTEVNMWQYYIYRSYDNSVWSLIDIVQHPTNFYLDNSVQFTKPIWAYSVKYKVVAINSYGLSSNPSNEIETLGRIDIQASQKNKEKEMQFLVEEEIIQNQLYNYPNPFNPTTRITFSLKENNHVTMKIFDILGNEVANLVEEFKLKGHHNVDFDASKLSSGIYFCRLLVGNEIITRKMLFTK